MLKGMDSMPLFCAKSYVFVIVCNGKFLNFHPFLGKTEKNLKFALKLMQGSFSAKFPPFRILVGIEDRQCAIYFR